MKKALLVTGVAVLALASVASAATAPQPNLTVGSTGAEVSALQTWLISNGFDIPAISAGTATKGYFGSQTKTALASYQKSVGLPAYGFYGPLTYAKISAGTTGTAAAASNCLAGWTAVSYNGVSTCLPPGYAAPAGATTVTTPTTVTSTGTITTPGVPGIMTVSQGPISSAVANVGQTMVPVLTVRVQAQYSDLAVQSMTLDLGSNTTIYNKIYNKIYVTDGTNVLASVPLNSSTVVQSGSDYVVGLAGFNFIVPKGTYKDLVVKADLNSSIDSSYLSQNWTVSLAANSLRAVDGAGVNLYGPTGAFSQSLTVNKSLVDNAQASISLDSSSPLAASIPVTDTTNGQYLGLPVLVFDVNAQNDNLHLHDVKVAVTTSGTGQVGAAYLYQGSTLITSASVVGGIADFQNITDGTAGATINRDQTLPYTVKVDVTGVTSGTLAITASASSTGMTIYNSIDASLGSLASGIATGNTQTVNSAGPLFTLAGTPTITKTNITAGGATTTTFQYTATYNLNVQAVGTDVNLGLPASSTIAFDSANADIYKNGVDVGQVATSSGAVNYSQPTNTTISSDGTYFTIARNQSVSIPVTFSFTVDNPGSATYAVQLQKINWATLATPTGSSTFMMNQPAWRTSPAI